MGGKIFILFLLVTTLFAARNDFFSKQMLYEIEVQTSKKKWPQYKESFVRLQPVVSVIEDLRKSVFSGKIKKDVYMQKLHSLYLQDSNPIFATALLMDAVRFKGFSSEDA